MFYIDDSGLSNAGLALYTAIGIPVHQAADTADAWQRLRTTWSTDHGVPVDYELHTCDFLAGRGRPDGHNPTRLQRRRMAQGALDVIAAQPAITITTVYAEELVNRRAARVVAYEGLLHRLGRQLEPTGESAALVVDGDGSEELYAHAHRRILPARIAQPATQEPAHLSHWLQMADLVAHTAFQGIIRNPRRQFMWGWYARHLPKAPAPERC